MSLKQLIIIASVLLLAIVIFYFVFFSKKKIFDNAQGAKEGGSVSNSGSQKVTSGNGNTSSSSSNTNVVDNVLSTESSPVGKTAWAAFDGIKTFKYPSSQQVSIKGKGDWVGLVTKEVIWGGLPAYLITSGTEVVPKVSVKLT